jgi:hypothetical protein
VSGKPLDQPPPEWLRLIDLSVWVDRAAKRLLPADRDPLDLGPVRGAVWNVLDTQPTFLRLVFSKHWDADKLQSLEYLRIDRRAGTAKVQVRGRIADGDGREDKQGWQVIARQLGIPANDWVRDAYDLEKRFSRRRPFVLEFDRRAVEATVAWLLTGRQPVAALAAPRVTRDVVLKAVSPEVLEELRLLFQSVQSPPRQSETREKSAESGQQGAARPAMPRRAANADYDACVLWSAARKKDGLTSGNQLREDAPQWCKENNVEYGDREPWRWWLYEHRSNLRRGTGKHR